MTLKQKPKEMLHRDWSRRLSAGTFAINGLLRKNAYRGKETHGADGMQTTTFLMPPKASEDEYTVCCPLVVWETELISL